MGFFSRDKTESEEDRILRIALKQYDRAAEADAKELELAQLDLAFEANTNGCQWPEKSRIQREAQYPPRPCIVVNKLPEKLAQAEGEFRQMHPNVKVLPRDGDADPIIAGIMKDLIRQIEYAGKAKAAKNTAHGNSLRCGRGAWEIAIVPSTNDQFTNEIVFRRIIDISTVKWDSSAKEFDRSDGKFLFIDELVNKDVFEEEYPDAPLDGWPRGKEYANWITQDAIRVVRYWWKERAKKKIYLVERPTKMANGSVVETKQAVERLWVNEEPLDTKEVDTWKVKYCKMIANKILEGPDEWPGTLIPVALEFGQENCVDGKIRTYGKVRQAMDPCMLYNYWVTSDAEDIALAPKARFMATAKMLGKSLAQWMRSNVSNDAVLLYEVDDANPNMIPQQIIPPQMSSAKMVALDRMDHDIMAATGRYQAGLGDKGDEKSGRAIEARQRQGSTGDTVYTDNFISTDTYSTKVLIEIIPSVFDTEQVVRVRGEDDSERQVPINYRPEAYDEENFNNQEVAGPRDGVTEYINDMTIGKYDLVLTPGTSYVTQRQETVAMLLDLVKAIPQIGVATFDLIVKNLDVSGIDELIKRSKKMIPPELLEGEDGEGGQPQQPQQPQMDPMMVMQLQIQQMKMQLEEREQTRKEFDSQVDAIKKLTEAEAKERGQQLSEMTAAAAAIRQSVEQFSQAQQAPAQAPGAPQPGPGPTIDV